MQQQPGSTGCLPGPLEIDRILDERKVRVLEEMTDTEIAAEEKGQEVAAGEASTASVTDVIEPRVDIVASRDELSGANTNETPARSGSGKTVEKLRRQQQQQQQQEEEEEEEHRVDGAMVSQADKEEDEEIAPGEIDLVWQPLRRAREVLKLLLQDRYIDPFTVPVDLATFPDYLNFVQQPMDLGTVMEKLERYVPSYNRTTLSRCPPRPLNFM